LRVNDPGIVACLRNLPAGDDATLEVKQFIACAGEMESHT
jgi:hypothetical protein